MTIEIVYTSEARKATTPDLSALEAQPGRTKSWTSKVEHPAVSRSLCQHLEKTGRAKVHYIGVDFPLAGLISTLSRRAFGQGRGRLDDVANNETGTIFRSKACRSRQGVGPLFHTDVCKPSASPSLSGQLHRHLSLSGHKLHAPKGIGALYVQRGARFRPTLAADIRSAAGALVRETFGHVDRPGG